MISATLSFLLTAPIYLGSKVVIVHACCFVLYSERLKNDELSAAKKEEESKLAREKMREEQRRRREAVSRVEIIFPSVYIVYMYTMMCINDPPSSLSLSVCLSLSLFSLSLSLSQMKQQIDMTHQMDIMSQFEMETFT